MADAAKTIRFERRLADGSAGVLGHAVKGSDGWRFLPATQHRPSRKAHPTLEACLPRWVGYPHRCESRAVEGCR
jgi:hypothetical protein